MSRNQRAETSIVDFAGVVAWYQAHCDGDWEHRHGIRLETLDNPGWQLTVDLVHTNLQGRTMAEVVEGCDPSGHSVSPHWIQCVVRDNQFRGACDPTQLAKLFSIFDAFRADD